MIKKAAASLFVFLAFCTQVYAQDIQALKQKIESIVQGKAATVGVAIEGFDGNDNLHIDGDGHYPMQSVFKFHIALVVLSEVDKGNLSLDQKIHIKESELLPGLWSPIRKKYPQGATLTLAEILHYTVALSDNVGCDVLIRLIGEPQDIERYFAKLGFKDFAVKINEETMQSNWDMQFLNWTTPKEGNRVLTAFYENKIGLLSKESYDFIWDTMKGTKTGKNRLRGQLPEGTIVAHKTGWSGQNKETGITAAVNNIGIVFLPNGEHFYISVFVTDSKEDFQTNEKMVADIAKAAWDYFSEK